MQHFAASALDGWLKGWSTDAPTTYQRSNELAFQRWFRFKEAFSPLLVRDVMSAMPIAPRMIVDCCAGSGTTGLVAQLSGIESALIEINPFLVDLIDAKTSRYDSVDFAKEISIFDALHRSITVSLEDLRDRLPPTFIEPGVKGRWMFNGDIAVELERIRLATLRVENLKLRKFYIVALASIVIHFSNARIDGKGRRYRQGWNKRLISGGDVYQAFKDAVYVMVRDIYAYDEYKIAKCSVVRGDSRKVISLIDSNVDLFIFSPPYPNSFDYTDIYNLELWFLEYFRTAQDNTELRKRTVRSHVQVCWDKPTYSVKSKALSDVVSLLCDSRDELWDKRIPDMVQAYFEDMNTLISVMREKMSRQGRIAMVVGDSSYVDIWIESAKIICELAENNGLRVSLQRSERVMRASAQHRKKEKFLNEWLLVFEKS